MASPIKTRQVSLQVTINRCTQASSGTTSALPGTPILQLRRQFLSRRTMDLTSMLQEPSPGGLGAPTHPLFRWCSATDRSTASLTTSIRRRIVPLLIDLTASWSIQVDYRLACSRLFSIERIVKPLWILALQSFV